VAAIVAVLDSLEDWPGGSTGWLHDHGLPDAELDLLVAKLTLPDGLSGPVKRS
jgi:hypothetical protein